MAKRGGQPGNTNATKTKYLSARLRARLEERAKQDELVDVLIDKALDGDMSAIKEVIDRIDGKAKQSMEVEASISHKDAKEMTDDELASIASTSSK